MSRINLIIASHPCHKQYPGLQYINKLFNSLKSGTWPGNEIRGMIRPPAVNCAPTLDCSQDASKTAAETASDEMVIRAVRALLVLAMGPNSRFGSRYGSDPEPDCCNEFAPKTHSSKVNISCSSYVLEFSSYCDIIYTWNMQFNALFHLPFSDLQSDQLSWSRDRNLVILTWFSA